MSKKFIFLKKQILWIKDIRETVKALEKISAANVHNLEMTAQIVADYEAILEKIFCDIPEKDISHPLFNKRQSQKRLQVILTTEKGLCGALLNRLLDLVQSNLKKDDKILVVGEKGRRLLQERMIKIDYFFQGTEDIPREKDIKPIRDFVISQFMSKKISQVLIFYPRFKSLAVQNPTFFSFLPFDKETFKKEMKEENITPILGELIYEPNKKQIMDYLVKEYLGLVFNQKVLEAKLSELSARTVAMKDASENAKKLVSQLSYQYFEEKREAITKNITDLYSHRAIR